MGSPVRRPGRAPRASATETPVGASSRAPVPGHVEPLGPVALVLRRDGDDVRVDGLAGVTAPLAAALAPGRHAGLDRAYAEGLDGQQGLVRTTCEGREWSVRVLPLTGTRPPSDGSAPGSPRAVVVASPATEPDETERALRTVERLGGITHWEWRLADNDLRWSPELIHAYGLEAHDVPHTFAEASRLIHPDDVPRIAETISAVVAHPRRFELDLRTRRADGGTDVVRARGEVEVDEEGTPVRLYGTAQDVSDLRRAEAALRESEERSRQLTENLRSLVWLLDVPTMRCLYVNPAFERIYDLPRGALEHDPFAWLSRVHPDDAVLLRSLMEDMRGDDWRGYEMEHRVVRPDGTVRWVRAQTYPIRDDHGHVVRVMGTGEDVTQRHEIEAAVRESEARLRQIAEHLRAVVWLYDTRRDSYLYVSPAYAQILGLDPDDLGDDPGAWLSHVHAEDREDVETALRVSVENDHSPVDIEYRWLTSAGEVRWVHARAVPVRDGYGDVYRVLGTVEDVTERRRAAAALRESELRMRQIAENTPFMFWLQDSASGRFLYVNDAYERIFDQSLAELYEDPSAWLQPVHPEDRERAAVIPEGEFDEEYRVLAEDGAVRWVRARSYPVHDEEGRPYRRVGVAEDVTHRRLLQDELVQAQKLEAVGRLAGGVSHDFNNLLFVILNYAEEVMYALPPDGSARKDLQHVLDAAERARALTKQMLTFSRRQPADPVDLDLNAAVSEVVDTLRRVLGEHVDIALDLDAERPYARLDATQFQQLVLNLAVNARDAMPDGGTLRIATRADEGELGGDRVPTTVLEVTDSGHGMRPDVAAHAFEPFYTTKPVGQGTGLGLSSVYGIVEAAGGHVTVDSSTDRGTTVTVRLPALARPAPADERPSPGVGVDGGGSVALVVEDEEDVRAALCRTLRRAGFVVHEAPSGSDAVQRCQGDLAQVDLLVTDVVMPGMSGPDLVTALADLGVRPPVVYVSGYPGETVGEDLSGPRQRFLRKPFRAEQLFEALDGLGVASETRPSR